MKFRVVMAWILITIAVHVLSGCSNSNEVEPVNMGIPLEEHYNGMRRRSAWDIELCDGKLFVANGDYDANTGSVYLYYYDLQNNQWIESTTLPESQIERFVYLNGVLSAPGADANELWDWGNYYIFDGQQWITKRNIPGGLHVFDMIEYDSKIFAGLGVLAGEFPIAMSSDDGETFKQIPMYRDGKPFDTNVIQNPDGSTPSATIRVYDFFEYDNDLYALFLFNKNGETERTIYKYDDDVFYYYCDLSQQIAFHRVSYEILATKTQFKDKLFISSGNLYSTTDLKDFQIIFPEGTQLVSDLQVIDDTLYVLSSQQNDTEDYVISVWYSKTGDANDFKQLFCFSFPCAAQAMTYADGVFYFGMGDGRLSQYNSANGTILSVAVDQKNMP